ncbi:MAG: GTP-binding protein, partial [bacterium]
MTEIPGTTRDALTETIDVQGIPVRLVDTAGIRQASDLVESLGVQKSLDFLKQSDLVLFVVDRNAEFAEDDLRVWANIRHAPCILVLNKEDLPAHVKIPDEIAGSCAATVHVSALRRVHLDELKEAILQAAAPEGGIEREGVVLTNARHKQCVELARRYLQSGLQSYESGLSEEFPLYEFRKTLEALGQITGETTVEDILQQIFST